MIDTIYLVRHGFRSNWVTTPNGDYAAVFPPPTGIPTDPALAAHGVTQAEELAEHLVNLDDRLDLIYSSPFYRCIQTLKPSLDRLLPRSCGKKKVRIERGFGEVFNVAETPHPGPASLEVLDQHFPDLLDLEYSSVVVPNPYGETIPHVHERAAEVLHRVISQLDNEAKAEANAQQAQVAQQNDSDRAEQLPAPAPAPPTAPRSILICSHAATIIALARALTGSLPQCIGEPDFRPYTCGLFKFVRRCKVPTPTDVVVGADGKGRLDWKNGKGVAGGWDCVVNADCSFLANGGEREWSFGDDDIYRRDPSAFDDYVSSGTIAVMESGVSSEASKI